MLLVSLRSAIKCNELTENQLNLYNSHHKKTINKYTQCKQWYMLRVISAVGCCCCCRCLPSKNNWTIFIISARIRCVFLAGISKKGYVQVRNLYQIFTQSASVWHIDKYTHTHALTLELYLSHQRVYIIMNTKNRKKSGWLTNSINFIKTGRCVNCER